MTVLDPLVEQLSRVGDELAAAAEQRRRRVRAAALAVGGTLAFAGAAAAAAPLWQPVLGGESRGGHPAADATRPPAEQLRTLSVLRRAQTAADRDGASERALVLLSPRNADGVRLPYVRAVATAGGPDVVLIPARSGFGKRDALCLSVADTVDGGALGCFSTGEVLAGDAVVEVATGSARPAPAPDVRVAGGSRPPQGEAIALPNPDAATMRIFGLVPDGVAGVRLGAQAAAVRDNVFQLSAAEPAGTGLADIAWLGPAGRKLPKR